MLLRKFSIFFIYVFFVFTFDVHSNPKKKDSPVELIQNLNEIERNISTSLITSINQQVLKGGYLSVYIKGKQILEINEILQRNSLIPIASISKSFTAFAILKLVEGGYVKLSEPISKYIPELLEYKELKGDKEITVRDLLQHTSGIPYEGNRTLIQISLGQRKYNIPIQFHPAGEKFIYSNHNYRLLAKIVENTIGQNIGEYVKEVIFEPLEILDYDINYYDGAAGIGISPDGLYRFSAMILGGGRLEGREFIQRRYFKLFFKTSQASKNYYGLGWKLETTQDKKKIEAIWHNGQGEVANSLLKIYPQKKLIVIFFMVQSKKNPNAFFTLYNQIEKKIEKYLQILSKLETLPLNKFPPFE